MKDVMGVINVVGRNSDLLGALTGPRCIASVPFGGKYRLIDFVLSSMANSGMQNVAVFTREKYRSLMDHLGSGKNWDLSRKQDGLIILPPHSCDGQSLPDFDLKSFFAHRNFFDRSSQKIVVVASANIICNVYFREAVRYHQETGADITVFYSEMVANEGGPPRRCLKVNETGRVLELVERQSWDQGTKVLLEIYILSKSLLMNLAEKSFLPGGADLLTGGIIPNLQKFNVCAYPLKGYSAVVDTIDLYYRHSMDLLCPQVWEELFFIPGLIHTKVKDEPPTRYLEGSAVANSLLANGCTIAGTVENSILFRGVRVHRGARVKNSVIMQKCEIGEGALVERVILDKDVRVSAGKALTGHDKKPLVVEKRKIV
ncbi:MAG: glucose-1-phosphate adenylyltransferase subunit GlgD [Bacillota bacterium]